MNRLYFLVILGLTALSLLFIGLYKWREAEKVVKEEPVVSHPLSPYASYISGVGIVEASSENIFIGAPSHRIVEKIQVTVGSKVKKGDILVQLESRDLEAELSSRKVAYEIAKAKVERLKAMPRQEDISAAEAKIRASDALLQQAKSEYERVQGLQNSRALSLEDINKRRSNYEQARANFLETQANLKKVTSGTWAPDLDIAQLEVLQSKAELQKIRTEIQRTIIRSPIDGKVLQIKIHEGEFPPPDTSRTPIMIVGNTDEKHLEVSINQYSAPYFRHDALAVALLQGNPKKEFHLEFISLDPYLVNKQNLTNDIQEKVDTRVLKVTYRFKEGSRGLYVGQQMDVFIKADFDK